MRIFLLLLLGSISVIAQSPATGNDQSTTQQGTAAQEQPIPDYNFEKTEPISGGSSLIRGLGSLILVIGLILGLSWAFRKYGPGQLRAGGSGNHFKFIQNFPLGQKKYLSLVEVEGRKLLLGITDHQISLLKSFEEFPYSEAVEQMDGVKTVSELLEESKGASQ